MLSNNPEGVVFYSDIKNYMFLIESSPGLHWLIENVISNTLRQYQLNRCSECNKRFWIKHLLSKFKENKNMDDILSDKQIKLEFVTKLLNEVEYMCSADWIPQTTTIKSFYKLEYLKRIITQVLIKMFPKNAFYIRLAMIFVWEDPSLNVAEKIAKGKEYLKTTNDLLVWLTYIQLCIKQGITHG